MATEVNSARLQAIVEEVMSELRRERGDGAVAPRAPANGRASAPAVQPGKLEPGTPPASAGGPVFADVNSAVVAARQSYAVLRDLPLALRKRMVAAMRQAGEEYAQVLAQEAQQETGMGRVEDKVEKNLLNARKTPGTEFLEPSVWTGDHGLTLVEWAPFGVICSITPSTNPTSTVICNSIAMIAAGNAVVFNAHPMAKRCSAHTVRVLNEAIVRVGGPPNLVACTAEPTIESAQALMRHPGVRLILVTGGPQVVKEAMASGKRAICAGPGNPPVVVDETADLDDAGRNIVKGASFDNNIICTDEKEVFAVEAIADPLKKSICAHGAIEINSWQLNRLMKAICKEVRGPRQVGLMNKDFIGKDASVLLKEIGIQAGKEIRLVLAEVDHDHPLIWTEQMMPILPLTRVRDADEGIDLAVEAEHGYRHTAVMHSKNVDHLSRMAREMDCSIFVKNGPNLSGLGYNAEGFCSFSIASPTGEGLTSPRSFSRIRRCALVDSFRIV